MKHSKQTGTAYRQGSGVREPGLSSGSVCFEPWSRPLRCHCAQSSMSVQDPQHASSAVIVIDDDDEEQVSFSLCIGYKVLPHFARVTQHDHGYTLDPQAWS